jgi:peptide-methionine (R)-S-oxide reductase
MMNFLRRRNLLFGCAALLAGCGRADAKPKTAGAFAGSEWRDVSEAEWKKRLAPAAFAVLRREDTERPWSSPLNKEKRRGTFVCAGCALPLFSSDWKYDSGTGWPSFWTGMKQNIATKRDFKLIIPRTEYHCARCLGHQGHILPDGPPNKGGIRYCNNGLALNFTPA